MGEEALVRAADTSKFNWTATHPLFGSVVHAVCFGSRGDERTAQAYGNLLLADDDEARKRLDLLQYTLEQGADPHITASEDYGGWILGRSDMAQDDVFHVQLGGTSAVSGLLAAKRGLRLAEAQNVVWRAGFEKIGRALDLVSQAGTWRGDVARASVSERVLETWAGVLADVSTADTVILAQEKDASDAGDGIRAHSAVLRAASPVLAAMLSPGMREGDRQEIFVRGCSQAAVKVVLAVLYTSGLPGDMADLHADTLIEAMSLAHRWSAQHAVHILGTAIGKALDARVIESAMEVARLLNVPTLLTDCKRFYHRVQGVAQ